MVYISKKENDDDDEEGWEGKNEKEESKCLYTKVDVFFCYFLSRLTTDNGGKILEPKRTCSIDELELAIFVLDILFIGNVIRIIAIL